MNNKWSRDLSLNHHNNDLSRWLFFIYLAWIWKGQCVYTCTRLMVFSFMIEVIASSHHHHYRPHRRRWQYKYWMNMILKQTMNESVLRNGNGVCVHVSVSNKSIFAYICVSQCGEIEFNVIMKLEHCIVVYFLSLLFFRRRKVNWQKREPQTEERERDFEIYVDLFCFWILSLDTQFQIEWNNNNNEFGVLYGRQCWP